MFIFYLIVEYKHCIFHQQVVYRDLTFPFPTLQLAGRGGRPMRGDGVGQACGTELIKTQSTQRTQRIFKELVQNC
jgi:hypothetical protein